ncbi:MAG: hypothetical protein AAFX51_09210, partial [Cyanobacteria bacterium J06636_28]
QMTVFFLQYSDTLEFGMQFARYARMDFGIGFLTNNIMYLNIADLRVIPSKKHPLFAQVKNTDDGVLPAK